MQGIVQAPEGRGIFTNMSVAENLALGVYQRRDKAKIAEDTERLFTLFPKLRQRHQQNAGTTILLVKQNAHMALEVTHEAHVFDVGRIVITGSAKDLAASDDVRKRYLGVG